MLYFYFAMMTRQYQPTLEYIYIFLIRIDPIFNLLYDLFHDYFHLDYYK
jgi:hypothetical protein